MASKLLFLFLLFILSFAVDFWDSHIGELLIWHGIGVFRYGVVVVLHLVVFVLDLI